MSETRQEFFKSFKNDSADVHAPGQFRPGIGHCLFIFERPLVEKRQAILEENIATIYIFFMSLLETTDIKTKLLIALENMRMNHCYCCFLQTVVSVKVKGRNDLSGLNQS